MNALEAYLYYKEKLSGDPNDWPEEVRAFCNNLKSEAIEEFKVTENEFSLLLITRKYPEIFREICGYARQTKKLKDKINAED